MGTDRIPTMVDVARLAGVGLKTVSRYVNGEQNINPELATRIAKAISDLGYRRNLAAASIRPGWTSKVLGVVVSDLGNPFFFTFARMIETAARKRGYLVIIASSEDSGDLQDQIIDRLLGQRVDGLVIVPARAGRLVLSELRPPVPPTAVLDRPIDSDEVDTILADNYGGAFEATNVLLRNRPGRIGFLGDHLTMFTMRERHRGFVDAVAAASETGAPVPQMEIAVGGHALEDSAAWATELLERHKVNAIFAANNRAAMGAIVAFRKLGRRVPLIGFDDFEAAPLLMPAVSVVTQDESQMASIAVDRVVDRLEGKELPHENVTVVPTELILRGSELP